MPGARDSWKIRRYYQNGVLGPRSNQEWKLTEYFTRPGRYGDPGFMGIEHFGGSVSERFKERHFFSIRHVEVAVVYGLIALGFDGVILEGIEGSYRFFEGGGEQEEEEPAPPPAAAAPQPAAQTPGATAQ